MGLVRRRRLFTLVDYLEKAQIRSCVRSVKKVTYKCFLCESDINLGERYYDDGSAQAHQPCVDNYPIQGTDYGLKALLERNSLLEEENRRLQQELLVSETNRAVLYDRNEQLEQEVKPLADAITDIKLRLAQIPYRQHTGYAQRPETRGGSTRRTDEG